MGLDIDVKYKGYLNISSPIPATQSDVSQVPTNNLVGMPRELPNADVSFGRNLVGIENQPAGSSDFVGV
jgi:hypothetical protein